MLGVKVTHRACERSWIPAPRSAHVLLNSMTPFTALPRSAQVDFRPAPIRFPLHSRSVYMFWSNIEFDSWYFIFTQIIQLFGQ